MNPWFVLIAIGIANVSAIDVPALNDGEVASIVEQPRKNLRGVTATINDSDVSTESIGWLDAAHRMLQKNKKNKVKLTAQQKAVKKAKQLAKKAKFGGVVKKKNNGKKNNGKKNNGKKNGNKNKGKVKNPVQLNSERAECTDRGNKNWCTNEVRAIEIGYVYVHFIKDALTNYCINPMFTHPILIVATYLRRV